jgi:DNA-binding IclR family transcriptional regulator
MIPSACLIGWQTFLGDHMIAKRDAAAQRRMKTPTNDGVSRKILRALFAFSVEQPRHSAESLSEYLGAPLSSTYRYIGILRDANIIDEDGRGTFVLAPRVIGLAQAARAGTDLASVARPHMQRIAADVGETVILLRRSGDRAVCIERAEASSHLRLSFEVGTALPLHRGAGPKLLLANESPAEIEQTLGEIAHRDPNFSTSNTSFMRELKIIRARGWSESRAEITSHVYAVAAGIVTSTGIIAAISFVAPAFRTPKTREAILREQLTNAATAINRDLAALSM